jgi:periplasmic divalent cation tolerance protein
MPDSIAVVVNSDCAVKIEDDAVRLPAGGLVASAHDCAQVTTVLPDREAAAELARAAVEARLAASAQISGRPIESVYRTGGVVETAEEWRVMFKTLIGQADDLVRFIAERHPYDVPEILAFPILYANKPYLDWIRETAA